MSAEGIAFRLHALQSKYSPIVRSYSDDLSNIPTGPDWRLALPVPILEFNGPAASSTRKNFSQFNCQDYIGLCCGLLIVIKLLY